MAGIKGRSSMAKDQLIKALRDSSSGARVTLVGLVRPAPDPMRAMQQWGLDDAAAAEVARAGTYLHVTQIGAANR